MRTEGSRVAECEHKTIRCTNGEFFCLACGVKLEPEEIVKPQKAEAPKRRTKKGATKE